MLYSSPDGRFKVSLSKDVISQLKSIIKDAKNFETGGIILGSYTQDRLVANVKHITGPPKDSEFGPTWFRRGVKGLQKLLDKHWKRKEYYLGEWHYHPNASANPSMQDIVQMHQISNAKVYHCPEPILLIIGGDFQNYEIRIFISLGNQKLIEPKTNMIELVSNS